MTREEAIQALKKEKRTALHENKVAFNMAIKALSQEPCDVPDINVGDMISRQAVLSYIERILNQGTGKKKSFEFIRKFVESLPSVQPQPKTGHWIKHDNGAWWECSECHAERAYGNEYCPDCGSHNGDIAKMIEPQESEVRNDRRN